jgi:hypothetical protein
MYRSLLQHCDNFHLYIYAFDDICYKYLQEQNFSHLTVISLKDFENEELLKIKNNRTAAEYCWTCSSSTIHHSITTFNLDICTYVDADILFYSNPRVLINEIGNNSVLITSHRYSSQYDQSAISGKYCVQFMSFKNTTEGMQVLNWWKNACIDWCYARVEDGKFGDQKYVDEFRKKFTGVHELMHLGGGVAPWNIQQYSLVVNQEKISGIELKTNNKFDLVFFHFHGLKFYEKNIVSLTGALYEIDKSIQELLFFPYVRMLNIEKKQIQKKLPSIDPNGNAGKTPYKPMSHFLIIWFYLSEVKKSFKNISGGQLKKRIAQHYFFYNKFV